MTTITPITRISLSLALLTLAELAVLGFQVRMDVRAKVTMKPACIGSQQFVDRGL